jgi:hypothetical protein
MPRYKPQHRKEIIAALKKLSKRKDVGGPTILAAIDRWATLDHLYEVELVRPKERPDKWADPNPPSLPEPETPEQDKKADEIYKRYLEETFNKGEKHEQRVDSSTQATASPATGSSGSAS